MLLKSLSLNTMITFFLITLYLLNFPAGLATGIFNVQLFRLERLGQERLNGSCCNSSTADGTTSSANSCRHNCLKDLNIRLCLKEYVSYEISETPKPYSGNCTFGNGIWTAPNVMNFSQKEKGFDQASFARFAVNIDFRWLKFFTLILEVFDGSPKKRHIVERFVYRGVLQPGKDWYQIHQISRRGVALYYALQITCNQYFYTDTCSKLCRPRNDIYGHYGCSRHGNKICLNGWMGSECKQAVCREGCHPEHGHCSRPNECRCRLGWQGDHCDQCIKAPKCRHGRCAGTPFGCQCYQGWGGEFCDQDINLCARPQNICLNGGICKNTNSVAQPFLCICPQGYNGTRCETRQSLCQRNPCTNGGECLASSDGSFQCHCLSGWTGDLCEVDVDDCAKNPCSDGQICWNLPGDHYECRCPSDPVIGQTVALNNGCQSIPKTCFHSPCKNAQRCWKTPSGEDKCQCLPGWEGPLCDKNIDDCPEKCKNGGECKDLVNNHLCLCKPGFAGFNCELDIDECARDPCLNGGLCRPGVNTYSCECPVGFTGPHCETVRNACNPNPCTNAGLCSALEGNDFFCRCPGGLTGKVCDVQRDSLLPHCTTENGGGRDCPRLENPCGDGGHGSLSNASLGICGNHGSCIHTGGLNFVCQCHRGFQGRYCEENIDDCDQKPCRNNGTCLDGVAAFQCLCPDGFEGEQCDKVLDPCQPNPCRPGSICKPLLRPGSTPDFQCSCSEGQTGRLCQSRGPACHHFTCFNGGQCVEAAHNPGGFRCVCSQVWTGVVCQIKLKHFLPCSRVTCKNKGTCVNLGQSFNCVCREGFEGTFCEKNVNECGAQPCFNGGVCNDLINSYECLCKPGFTGPRCQIRVRECIANPCAYGSTCIDLTPGFTCICPAGRRGRLCEEVVQGANTILQAQGCRYKGRNYIHQQEWMRPCRRCKCLHGKVNCKEQLCGRLSCLDSRGSENHKICPTGEYCQTILPHPLKCFVPPCFPRGVCINLTDPDQTPWQYSESPYGSCDGTGSRSYSSTTNNWHYSSPHCARVVLNLSRGSLPRGIGVDDVCAAVRSVTPSLSQNDVGDNNYNAKQVKVAMVCTLRSGQPDIVVITLSVPDVKLNNGQVNLPINGVQTKLKRTLTVDQIANKIVDNVVGISTNDSILSAIASGSIEAIIQRSSSASSSLVIPMAFSILGVVGVFIIAMILLLYHFRNILGLSRQRNNLKTESRANNETPISTLKVHNNLFEEKEKFKVCDLSEASKKDLLTAKNKNSLNKLSNNKSSLWSGKSFTRSPSLDHNSVKFKCGGLHTPSSSVYGDPSSTSTQDYFLEGALTTTSSKLCSSRSFSVDEKQTTLTSPSDSFGSLSGRGTNKLKTIRKPFISHSLSSPSPSYHQCRYEGVLEDDYDWTEAATNRSKAHNNFLPSTMVVYATVQKPTSSQNFEMVKKGSGNFQDNEGSDYDSETEIVV